MSFVSSAGYQLECLHKCRERLVHGSALVEGCNVAQVIPHIKESTGNRRAPLTGLDATTH